jgi:hypothetical protein
MFRKKNNSSYQQLPNDIKHTNNPEIILANSNKNAAAHANANKNAAAAHANANKNAAAAHANTNNNSVSTKNVDANTLERKQNNLVRELKI